MEISRLYEFAEELNIDIDDFPMLKARSQSQMAHDGTCHIAIDSRRFETLAELKVALAHELGHCATSGFYTRHSSCDVRSGHEYRANKMAAHLLIPFDKLANALAGPWNSVLDLAEQFGVTEKFILDSLKIYECELLNLPSHTKMSRH